HAARALAMGGVVASDDEIGSLADALVRATSVEDLERDDGIPHPDELRGRLARGAGQPVVDAWRTTVAARALGQSAGAGPAWAEARHAWRGLGRAPMLAVTSWHEGVARLAAGEQDLARAALSEAEAIAERLDAVSLLVEVRATVASAGAAEPPVEAASSDELTDVLADDLADLLTTRETEVLSLVALGWTNKRVGEELGIGHRTVATHLSRVLAKLEVSSRGEATVVAHRAGMVGEPREA
ncbi:helix-turn-helix transcriptional regulator, partial [Salsipaludibacter albus]|uniref:helix-turn-helix transcriptional regulator n=1 Tax=Salsipaludibacter albus TaxID=2849650 RepID=UPI001EE3E0CE